MIATSLKLFVATLMVGSSIALAVEFIELNDHNLDMMPLETGKSLKAVQEAMKIDYKFDSLSNAVKFVNKCKYLNEALKTVNDNDYEGLGGKMKTIVKDEQLVKLCSIDEEEMKTKFALLGAKDMGVQVTKKRLNDLIALGENLKSNPSIELMLNNLYEKCKKVTSENLLAHAAEDTTVFFGEHRKGKLFDFGPIYKTGCEITPIKQICKLVRRTNLDNVQALGADVSDFIEIIKSNDKTKIDNYVKESGVTMEQLKENCLENLGSFHSIKMVELYKEANYISNEMIAEQSRIEPNFYLFNELYKLCKLVTTN